MANHQAGCSVRLLLEAFDSVGSLEYASGQSLLFLTTASEPPPSPILCPAPPSWGPCLWLTKAPWEAVLSFRQVTEKSSGLKGGLQVGVRGFSSKGL